MDLTSKEALEELREDLEDNDFDKKYIKRIYNTIKKDLERLEELEKENQELNDVIEIRKQMNINLIDFGTKLKQENEKLKKIIKENFWVFNNDEVLFKFNENIPVMQEEIKEVLENE